MDKKIIHYCWFGPNEIPEKEKKCIASWSKLLPDFEIKFWNESNFDVNENRFCKEAYEAKKYAFVSDYVRTKIIYLYGGIYLDSDVEVFNGFEAILNQHKNFLGFETKTKLGTAVMAFEKEHPLIKDFLNFYQQNPFINEKGEVNTIANVTILTDLMIKKGLKIDGSNQKIDDIEVFNREYFYPKKINDELFKFTNKTVAVHKCSNSWMTDREKKRGKNIFWINVMRPLLRNLRALGLKLISEKNIQKIEVGIWNKLK